MSPEFAVSVRRSRPTESRAWCETGCVWDAVDGKPGSYRASRAARRHTAATGHTTTFDRGYSVFIEVRRGSGETAAK